MAQLVSVPYQHPKVRALATGQRTALAGLAATLVLAAYPLVKAFIDQGDLSQTAVKALAFGLAGTLLAAAFAYGQKYLEAKAEPVTPALSLTAHEGFVQGHVEAVSLPALPVIDPALVVNLVEDALHQYLAAPIADTPPVASRARPPAVPATNGRARLPAVPPEALPQETSSPK